MACQLSVKRFRCGTMRGCQVRDCWSGCLTGDRRCWMHENVHRARCCARGSMFGCDVCDRWSKVLRQEQVLEHRVRSLGVSRTRQREQEQRFRPPERGDRLLWYQLQTFHGRLAVGRYSGVHSLLHDVRFLWCGLRSFCDCLAVRKHSGVHNLLREISLLWCELRCARPRSAPEVWPAQLPRFPRGVQAQG